MSTILEILTLKHQIAHENAVELDKTLQTLEQTTLKKEGATLALKKVGEFLTGELAKLDKRWKAGDFEEDGEYRAIKVALVNVYGTIRKQEMSAVEEFVKSQGGYREMATLVLKLRKKRDDIKARLDDIVEGLEEGRYFYDEDGDIAHRGDGYCAPGVVPADLHPQSDEDDEEIEPALGEQEDASDTGRESGATD